MTKRAYAGSMPDTAIFEVFQTPSDTLRYEPRPAKDGGQCIELKSLKLYYHSFRNEGSFFEAVTNTIREDLVKVIDPVWLQIETNWKGRGGIRSVIRADYGDVPGHFLGR